MTMNGYFTLTSVLRYVYSSEAWLSELGYSNLVVNVGEFKPQRTAAASRGFLATTRLSCQRNER